MRAGVLTRCSEWGRRHSLAGDVLLALVLFALSVLVLRYQSADCDCHVPVSAYVAAAGQTLPVAARRRAPFAVNVVVAPSAVIYGLAAWPAPPAPLGALTAIHAAAAYARRWQAALVLGVAVVMVPAVLLGRGAATTFIEVAYTWLIIVVAWLLGVVSRYRLRALKDAVTRQDSQHRLLKAEAARAAAEERARIAREMHDLLTHSVSGMVVLAEGGAAASADAHPSSSAIFDSISLRGRRTLHELRGMLGALRHEDGADTGSRPDADDGEERRPLPGLSDLPALIEAVREAGMEVTLSGVVESHMSPAAQLAVYRVAQESLTNALKHATGSPVKVLVAEDHSGVRLEVSNPVPSGSAFTGRGRGHGLRGMRERAASVGGRVHIDHTDDVWSVELFVPQAQRG
ncbi:sensor histidine kinase [Streptomyces collinus]